MLFNSTEFLVFLIIVFVLFWMVLKGKHRMQTWMLLIASCVFYMFLIPEYILILFLTITIDYFAALWIAKSKGRKRKIWLIASIISTCLVLFVFKYYNFFIENTNAISSFFGLKYSFDVMQIILPIGLSFHTFQSLSYVIEVYREKQVPEKDFVTYSLYVMYFPQLVAGPIERAANLLPQFHTTKKFDFALAAEGMHQILWGMFKKVVVADTCAAYANQAFDHYADMSGLTLIIGSICFAFQIYGDFSGYSDIALGTSKLFGIRLMRNFNLPYFATNIAEFWRRWHISLSTWFRDYVYFPLGGSRVGGWKQYRNVFAIFLLSGVWHGANWTFVVWGLIHAVVFSIYVLLFSKKETTIKQNDSSFWMNLMGTIVTFGVVTFAWIFFRAKNIDQAFEFIKAIYANAFIGKETIQFAASFILIIPFVVFEYFNRKSNEGVVLSYYQIRPIYRTIIELILALLIVDGYYTLNHDQFIYFQF